MSGKIYPHLKVNQIILFGYIQLKDTPNITLVMQIGSMCGDYSYNFVSLSGCTVAELQHADIYIQ